MTERLRFRFAINLSCHHALFICVCQRNDSSDFDVSLKNMRVNFDPTGNRFYRPFIYFWTLYNIFIFIFLLFTFTTLALVCNSCSGRGIKRNKIFMHSLEKCRNHRCCAVVLILNRLLLINCMYGLIGKRPSMCDCAVRACDYNVSFEDALGTTDGYEW